jgi:hypothetical protein
LPPGQSVPPDQPQDDEQKNVDAGANFGGAPKHPEAKSRREHKVKHLVSNLSLPARFCSTDAHKPSVILTIARFAITLKL